MAAVSTNWGNALYSIKENSKAKRRRIDFIKSESVNSEGQNSSLFDQNREPSGNNTFARSIKDEPRGDHVCDCFMTQYLSILYG